MKKEEISDIIIKLIGEMGMIKQINHNEYFMYSELPTLSKLIYRNEIYKFLYSLNWEYPNFKLWYQSLFSSDETDVALKNDREIIICGRNGIILGVSILKKNKEEQKICTLRVAKPYQLQGIGKNLMGLSLEWLDNQKPLITLHKSKQQMFSSLLDYYGFKLEQEQWNYYNIFSTELSYNGILPEKKFALNKFELVDVGTIYKKLLLSGNCDVNKFLGQCFNLWLKSEQERRFHLV